MLSIIIAVIVAVWFYASAQARQKVGWQWALIGGVSYAGTAFIVGNLSFLMIGPIRVDDLARIGITVIVASLAVAFVVVLLIHRQFLRKETSQEPADTSVEDNSGEQSPIE